MKSYRYELIAYENKKSEQYGNYGSKIKRFVGNDLNALRERYEMWVIKQSIPRECLYIYTGEIQHIGY